MPLLWSWQDDSFKLMKESYTAILASAALSDTGEGQ